MATDIVETDCLHEAKYGMPVGKEQTLQSVLGELSDRVSSTIGRYCETLLKA
jgi:hypothetical protein